MTMSNDVIVSLLDAIYDGDIQAIDSLIPAQIPVDYVSKGDLWNLLHYALVSVTIVPAPNAIQHVIDIGVEVNAKDRHGWTPLHYAVRTRSAPVVRVVIDAGAAINVADNEGVTPLLRALREYPINLEVVELLLRAGADQNKDFGAGAARAWAQNLMKSKDVVLTLMDEYAQ